MSKIWFTSDTHYHHKNIVRGTTSWQEFSPGSSHQSVRDFDTLEEHDEKLIDNINTYVSEEDTLYHLGDWSFGGIEQIWNFRKRLICEDIHLILGNHDRHIENNRKICFSEQYTDWDMYEDTERFGIAGEALREDYIFPSQIFTSVSHYKELQVKYNGHKHRIVMSHYAMRVWNKSHHGSIMLYGHSHGTLPIYELGLKKISDIPPGYMPTYARTMDVGVDTHPEFRPYSLDEIMEIMISRDVYINVDHHDSKTN